MLKMEWLFYLIVSVPIVFFPLLFFDIFTLPQTAFLALLSAVGITALGAGGVITVSLPVLLTLALIGYLTVNTFWTEVLDGAKKEFAIQFALLLTFILTIHLEPSSILSILIVMYCAGCFNQLYAFGQTLGIDLLFPFRLKADPKDRRPIGTSGNMNFLASYILPLFWIGLYLALTVSPLFFLGVVLTLFVLWKTKCRGAWIGFAVSAYGFLVLCSFGHLIDRGWLFVLIPLGFLSALVASIWLWDNWDRINNEKISGPNEERVNVYKGQSVKLGTNGIVRRSTLRYRICFWRAGWYLFKQQPWRGHGLRSYRKLVYFAQADLNEKDPKYLDPERYITPQPRECHNDWLEDLVELGLVGSLIRWLLIGLIFYLGFTVISDSFLALFLLTAMVSVAVHATFMFGLRMPHTGMVFWVLGGFLVLLSPVSIQTIVLPGYLMLPILVGFFAVYLWEMVGKELLASYHFMRYNRVNNVKGKEKHCTKAHRLCPKDTIYNTHLLIGYLNVAPQMAYKFAEAMWFDYDGMTPGWITYFNMGTIAEIVGNKELAYRFYATSYRMLPSFGAVVERLQNLEPFIPLMAKGEIMKKIEEVGRLNILLLQEKMINLDLQKQNLEVGIQNMVLQESNKLNIPEGWHYDFQSGIFLSPQEMEASQNQQQDSQTKGETG